VSARTVTIVLLALVFGGSAAYGINYLIRRPAAPKVDTVSVVVAAADVPRFTSLTPDQLTTRDYPKDLVPPGALTSVEDAVGRAPHSPLIKDEPLLDGKLTKKGAGRGLAAVVPNGMRAFTIQTPNVSAGVAGFILPGNKVDVLLTMSGQGTNDSTGGGSTTTLLQQVEILAVDQRVDAPSGNMVDPKELRSVTLLVTPDQAAKLDLGQNKGTLHLSLRNPEDREAANTRPATLAGLRFLQEKPWDERLKGLLELSAKLLAKKPTKEKDKAPVVAAAKPTPRLQIRTLRGNIPGSVELGQ
jgi:pilus assembly protein CpaB